MKTRTVLFLSLIFTMFLTACAGTEIQKETVVDIKTQLVTFPEPLLEPCSATAPPNRDAYVLIMNDKQRLEAMVGYATDLLGDLAKCNNRLVQIRDLQNKQKGIYKSTLENR